MNFSVLFVLPFDLVLVNILKLNISSSVLKKKKIIKKTLNVLECHSIHVLSKPFHSEILNYIFLIIVP